MKEFKEEKLGILDLKATFDDGTICNIEMQLTNKQNTEKRLLKYWAKLYSSQLKEKQEYEQLKPVISIMIVDYNLSTLSKVSAHTSWKIIETKYRQKVLTNDLELHIIMIPRALKECTDKALHNWLMFLDNPNSMEVKQMVKEDKDIEKAMDELETISGDKHAQYIAHLREKAIWDRNSELSWAHDEGHEQGLAEGQKEKQIEIAKKMLKENFDINTISKLTDLSIEEIEEINKN